MMMQQVFTRRFIIAALILLGATASVQGVVRWFKLALDKQEAPLRSELVLMPHRFGPYIRIEDQRLSKEIEQALGTTKYISWVFRDTRKNPDEPGSALRLHVPYYTGMIDTVPHVPDRCFVGGSGAQVLSKQFIPVELKDPQVIFHTDDDVTGLTMTGKQVRLPGDRITLSVVQFGRAGAEQTYCVSYFFIANDEFVTTPEGVRAQAFNAFDRYAYYCKIEVLPGSLVSINGREQFVGGIEGTQQTAAITADFLTYALPEIMYCLPDWRALNAGQPDPVAPALKGAE